MKVRCVHGYFFFEEPRAGDISAFCSTYGFDLVPVDWYYTFEKLAEAPDFSFKNLKYIDDTAIATETFAGKPWDVMRKNRLIYDFTDDTVKLIDTVIVSLAIDNAASYFYSTGLILPGSMDSLGQRVTDFSGHFPSDAVKFRYTEIGYDENL